MTNIKIVMGKLCSGKGHFCKQYPDHFHVTTSDVVKILSRVSERKHLALTHGLHQSIADQLYKLTTQHNNIIIDGIRQPEVLTRLLTLLSNVVDNNIELIWLDVPDSVRLERFHSRNSDKDKNSTFEMSEQGDIDLGIDKLFKLFYNRLTIYKNN